MPKFEKQQEMELMVYYVPRELKMLDVVVLVDGEYQRHPSCELISCENADHTIGDVAKRSVQRVSADEYMDKLGILPLHLRGGCGSESFKIREMRMGKIADIYVNIGKEHFTLRDDVSLSHSEIVQRVKAFIEAEIA
ncbi:hypothetical protein ACP179_01765 (plasmid) [Xenorhabdus stockiae]|uniref:hypothetical protein n=1 Tax=Xenorhabdus stockiae TaxID=351614 RepID=UPI003CF53952